MYKRYERDSRPQYIIYSLIRSKKKLEVHTASKHFDSTDNKHDSGEKTAVKKASDHSDVDMFAQALQFTSIMLTDEEKDEKITLPALIETSGPAVSSGLLQI